MWCPVVTAKTLTTASIKTLRPTTQRREIRDAGATQVTVAASPDENALFEALKRALPARLA